MRKGWIRGLLFTGVLRIRPPALREVPMRTFCRSSACRWERLDSLRRQSFTSGDKSED